MKKRKIAAGTAAALTAAATLGSCGIFEPPFQDAQCVYGPPSYFGMEDETLYGPSTYTEPDECDTPKTGITEENTDQQVNTDDR